MEIAFAIRILASGVWSLLLELAKPVSLLASIFSLLAVFHAAFLGPEEDLGLRILNAAGMAVLAGAVSLASGLIFTQECAPQRHVTRQARSNILPFRRRPVRPAKHLAAADTGLQGVIESFPMRIFYWTMGTMAALFLAAWFIETYCIPLSRLH